MLEKHYHETDYIIYGILQKGYKTFSEVPYSASRSAETELTHVTLGHQLLIHLSSYHLIFQTKN